MNRLIRLVLELMPRELRELTRAAGLDVEATCRLQPLAELFTLARKRRGWTAVQAAKFTHIRRRSIDAVEAANPGRIEPSDLITYAARLGALHLLGEWVTANPRLARSLGFPCETSLLTRGREVITEDARLANLLPDALSSLALGRFEAPADFSEHLDPDRAEQRLAEFFTRSKAVHSDSFAESEDAPPSSSAPAKKQPGKHGPSEVVAPALYEFRVALRDVQPAVVRRVVVSNQVTFRQFHAVLQAAMGWEEDHLHVFRWKDLEIGVPDEEWNHPLLDERRVRLADLPLRKRSRLSYIYDFGDGWDHDVTLVTIRPYQANFTPICIDGEGACPPEDCGGPAMYGNLIAALHDPEHPDHGTILEWLGETWDPARFIPADHNRALAALARRWASQARRKKGKKPGTE